MPSFRITMTIGTLRPGAAPQAVLPAAAHAAEEMTTLEAADVSVVAGSARVTVRFTADDAPAAVEVGRHVIASTGAVAEPVSSRITERVGGSLVPGALTLRLRRSSLPPEPRAPEKGPAGMPESGIASHT